MSVEFSHILKFVLTHLPKEYLSFIYTSHYHLPQYWRNSKAMATSVRLVNAAAHKQTTSLKTRIFSFSFFFPSWMKCKAVTLCEIFVFMSLHIICPHYKLPKGRQGGYNEGYFLSYTFYSCYLMLGFSE